MKIIQQQQIQEIASRNTQAQSSDSSRLSRSHSRAQVAALQGIVTNLHISGQEAHSAQAVPNSSVRCVSVSIKLPSLKTLSHVVGKSVSGMGDTVRNALSKLKCTSNRQIQQQGPARAAFEVVPGSRKSIPMHSPKTEGEYKLAAIKGESGVDTPTLSRRLVELYKQGDLQQPPDLDNQFSRPSNSTLAELFKHDNLQQPRDLDKQSSRPSNPTLGELLKQDNFFQQPRDLDKQSSRPATPTLGELLKQANRQQPRDLDKQSSRPATPTLGELLKQANRQQPRDLDNQSSRPVNPTLVELFAQQDRETVSQPNNTLSEPWIEKDYVDGKIELRKRGRSLGNQIAQDAIKDAAEHEENLKRELGLSKVKLGNQAADSQVENAEVVAEEFLDSYMSELAQESIRTKN